MASTSPTDCRQALRTAADRLGESPSKAQYESLGLTPASATIVRTMGGWNAAKEAAGLETAASRGSRVQSKPTDVDFSEEAWAELSVDQRWHYRHREQNATQTLDKRAKLRAWVYGLKRERGCTRCSESDPVCLDFHHRDGVEKTANVSELVSNERSRDTIRAEIRRCDVLCANCHRKEHAHYRFERLDIEPSAMVAEFGDVSKERVDSD
ncbi:homing endonuclease associated repeat-containing protein [Halogeometricum luteum]|uniref:HNH endonuclease n=1 Tax=Halogeometricum luteum TaxID=2950537 RepID=A0ABU2G5N0_9EURY|nr:HNH endonuclease [Halogeometricum sp. S3BR5-2]MDS0296085.1 HNH endonuclease [Halogeometricum sp. S3BR5-2]